MAAVSRVPVDATAVVILNALDATRNALGVITHAYLHAKAYAKPHVILDAPKDVIAYVNLGVHPDVPTHVVPSVHDSALVSAIIHALALVLVIVQAHLWHIRSLNRV